MSHVYILVDGLLIYKDSDVDNFAAQCIPHGAIIKVNKGDLFGESELMFLYYVEYFLKEFGLSIDDFDNISQNKNNKSEFIDMSKNNSTVECVDTPVVTNSRFNIKTLTNISTNLKDK